MIDLNKQIIVVVGGNGLLGSEFVKSIVNHNGICINADITNEEKENHYKIDITSEESVKDVIKKIHEKYGKIDAVINSAYPRNKNYGKTFFDVKYSDFCENINLHLGGFFLSSQKFGEYFINQGFGNIINISSIYGVISPKFEVYEDTKITMPIEYAAIKSSLIHLTKYMAKYFKNKKVRVNTISPGGIFDNQDEIFVENYKNECLNKGMLDKNDINGTVVFLLSEYSQYINGQNIIIDDGFTL